MASIDSYIHRHAPSAVKKEVLRDQRRLQAAYARHEGRGERRRMYKYFLIGRAKTLWTQSNMKEQLCDSSCGAGHSMWEGVSPYAQPVVPGIFRELAQQEHNKARRLQVRPHAHPSS